MRSIKPAASIDTWFDAIKLDTTLPDSELNSYTYFQTQIELTNKFSIGPHFWFIGDNAKSIITHVSDNIHKLTPFTKEEWVGKHGTFFIELLHPSDCMYVLSALYVAVGKLEVLNEEQRQNVHVNIYARALNAEKEYRWVLIQLPGLYVDKKKHYTCGFILITELSHFKFIPNDILMTITDVVDDQTQYFRIDKSDMTLKDYAVPSLSKREQEIIRLMMKGFTTPQIAKTLFISYNTVENHKSNLRKKTNTKSAASLISYILENNLL